MVHDIQKYPAGKVIIKQGEKGKKMYIIKQGIVDVAIDSVNGEKISLTTLGPGNFFGEMSFFEEKASRSAEVTAVTDVEAYDITREEWESEINNLSEWSQLLIRELINRIRNTNLFIVDNIKTSKIIFEKERVQTLVEFAGACAHEINQHLNVIQLRTEMLMEEFGNTEYNNDFQEIIKACDKIVKFEEKIQSIKRYVTKTYIGDIKIIDVNKASSKE